ncbi:hypothetical protein CSUI_009079 [Cystoisospora suis]|uniref:Uncharacterized protein n=1 Tax=Cystoisospora suis TaxID=483139 RepID=A0A2C6KKU8_9APIC|nr:hypothetical protein CSUI_009079 [Cystoisospora suis]
MSIFFTPPEKLGYFDLVWLQRLWKESKSHPREPSCFVHAITLKSSIFSDITRPYNHTCPPSLPVCTGYLLLGRRCAMSVSKKYVSPRSFSVLSLRFAPAREASNSP